MTKPSPTAFALLAFSPVILILSPLIVAALLAVIIYEV